MEDKYTTFVDDYYWLKSLALLVWNHLIKIHKSKSLFEGT